MADADDDGDGDRADILEWKRQAGSGRLTAAASTYVPELGALVLAKLKTLLTMERRLCKLR